MSGDATLETLRAELEHVLGAGRVAAGHPLAPLTTLGIGGPARDFVRVTSISELQVALGSDPRVLVLGGGSNLVLPDAG